MEKGNVLNRRSPLFARRDWHKNIRVGSRQKKKRKWRYSRGIDNKTRMGLRGYSLKPCLGWGSPKDEKGKISGLIPVMVHNLNELKNIGKGQGVMVASVGKKKKAEIIAKANEMKLTILNRYTGGKK